MKKRFCVIYFMPFPDLNSEYGAMSSVARKHSSELSARSNTRRAIRQQKMARDLKFRIACVKLV